MKKLQLERLVFIYYQSILSSIHKYNVSCTLFSEHIFKEKPVRTWGTIPKK